MGTPIDKLDYLKETKTLIKEALIEKNVQVTDTDTFRSYADKILEIEAPDGMQDKQVTPTTEEQIVTPDPGYAGLSSVIVDGDANLIPENIKQDVEIFGVTGTCAGGGGSGGTGNLQEKTVAPTSFGETVTADDGYDGLSSVTVVGDADLQPENIKNGVSLWGVVGTYSADMTSVGTTVTVEAMGAIAKGATWEGVLNDEYVPRRRLSQLQSRWRESFLFPPHMFRAHISSNT